MDPGKIVAYSLRGGSTGTGKLRRISYIHKNIVPERSEVPKEGQPILCNEMRDHISILPSKSHNGRAFVHGLEYLLSDTPVGAHLRPQRAVFSIADGVKSVHLPQAATLCNVGEEYVRPEIRTRVPRPVSVRVLGRCTLGSTPQTNKGPLISSFPSHKNVEGSMEQTQGSKDRVYGRARSSYGLLFRGTGSPYSADGGLEATPLDSVSSRIYDDSMDLTIYKDPCSIAREIASTKNNQAVTNTEVQTAGELHRIHESYMKSSISPNNMSSTSDMQQKEYRRPPVISLRSTANDASMTSRTTKPTSKPDMAEIEYSQSPPPTFSKTESYAVTPTVPSIVSTKEGGSGLHASALASMQAQASAPPSLIANRPPRTAHNLSAQAQYNESTADHSTHSSKASSVIAESSIHSYGKGSSLQPSSAETSDIAPESLLPDIPPIRPHNRARTAAETGVMRLQYRELDNLEASFTRYVASFTCNPNIGDGEIDIFSSTAPGVALPSMQTNDLTIEPSHHSPVAPCPTQTTKARSFSATVATVTPRRKFNVINDSAIPQKHTIRPSSRKQVTKPQNVTLGPAQRRGASVLANRWKANLH